MSRGWPWNAETSKFIWSSVWGRRERNWGRRNGKWLAQSHTTTDNSVRTNAAHFTLFWWLLSQFGRGSMCREGRGEEKWKGCRGQGRAHHQQLPREGTWWPSLGAASLRVQHSWERAPLPLHPLIPVTSSHQNTSNPQKWGTTSPFQSSWLPRVTSWKNFSVQELGESPLVHKLSIRQKQACAFLLGCFPSPLSLCIQASQWAAAAVIMPCQSELNTHNLKLQSRR